MNLSKKKFSSLIAIIIAVSMISGMMINAQSTQKTSTASTTLIPPYVTLTAIVRNAQGQILYNCTGKTDPLTQTGSSYLISCMANTTLDGAANKAVYMGLSNDSTPLVTWTTQPTLIAANGLSITAALTPTYGNCVTASGTSRYMMLNYTFVDSTANENVVQCMGIYYVSTGASGLVCVGTFTPACNLAPTDTIDCQYNMTQPCG